MLESEKSGRAPLRTLALETSGISGSIALIEDGKVLAEREHTEENQHAERMLGHIQSALAELRWSRKTLNRIAVSRGPGAFTGIRMGLALAQGLEMGLLVPALGVCSLRALAATPFVAEGGGLTPPRKGSLIIAVRDARRGELFVGTFDETFQAQGAPIVIPQEGARDALLTLSQGRDAYFVGHPCAALDLPGGDLKDAFRADPRASAVGLLGELEEASAEPVRAEYVRGPNLIKPKLPSSPLDSTFESHRSGR
jgi:tRNA threonylcarbamoyladenosine biosynthesis protein TsaB